MRLPDRLYAENVRGRRIPRVLGIVVVVGAAPVLAALTPAAEDPPALWIVGAATLLVAAAGLVDDLASIGPRGLRGHLRALLSGRMTTGILKVLVTVGAAAVVVAVLDRGEAPARFGAVTLIAATTNVWNGLDVRPGRALKAFVVVALVLAWAGTPAPAGTVGGAVLAAAVIVLLPDLREWAMLGDAGANLLGFTAGIMLAAALPTWAMWPAAAVAVALNVVAETVTFSRVIDAVAPLRWLDRLGTLR